MSRFIFPHMKKIFTTILLILGAVAAPAAVKVGDSYDAVIAEKGVPTGRMEAGGLLLLRYSDQTIKLKSGKVVALEVAQGSTVPANVRKPAPVVVSSSATVSSKWNVNFMGSLEVAKAQGRHVFVFFTGSDWCGWCQRLNREILKTPEFERYAAENLVLVEIDFPRAKSLPPAVVDQNAKLAKIFRIEGYPTVIILNSEGKPVGRLGYQEGGPAPFLEKLRSF